MPFVKGDPRINRKGRLDGARNKVNAQRDISKAVSSGKSLQDIVVFLSEKLDDDKISETQKNKYLEQLIKIKLDLAKQEIKLLEENTPKQDQPKPKGEVIYPKAVFKSSQ